MSYVVDTGCTCTSVLLQQMLSVHSRTICHRGQVSTTPDRTISWLSKTRPPRFGGAYLDLLVLVPLLGGGGLRTSPSTLTTVSFSTTHLYVPSITPTHLSNTFPTFFQPQNCFHRPGRGAGCVHESLRVGEQMLWTVDGGDERGRLGARARSGAATAEALRSWEFRAFQGVVGFGRASFVGASEVGGVHTVD